MAGKSIRELVIKVTQKNAIKVSKDIDRISDSLLEATEYAELFNQTLDETSATSFGSLVKSLDSIEKHLEDISRETRQTKNSIGALRNESMDATEQMINGFDEFGQTLVRVSDDITDLGNDTVRASQKAEAGMEGLTKATLKASGSAKSYTKEQGRLGNAMKDTTRQGTNQARQFSKMAQQAGGLASTYAVVAANVFALSEGFRLLSDAAAVDRLEEVSTVISAGIGVSIAGTAEAMKEATDGAISYQAALRQAAAATAFGFDTQQIEEFTQVARRASVVLGVEMTDALNRVIRGISKAEVELLDELGVTVRLNEAFARYAAQHNIAANSLNSFQRQQALANEVILKSEQNLSAADEALASTTWEQFGANISSATNQLLRFLSTSDSVISFLNSFNMAFEEITQLSRSDATFTPFTKTLDEADGALQKIVAYNNLMKETVRLENEGRIAREKSAELVGKGIDGTVTAEGLAMHGKELFALNDQYNTFQAQLTGVQHELDLSTESMNKFADSMGISVDEVDLVSSSIQNLGLLSRSLGSDLTSFNNDVMGKDSNPYRGLSSSISEATKDIDLLLKKNLSLDDALAKLKIDKSQFQQFGNIQGYIGLLDAQLEKEFEIQQVADAHGETIHGQLYLAQEQLVLMQQRHQYQQAAAGADALTLDQKKEQYALEQKIVGLEERSQALAYKNLQAQYALSTALHDANSARETALGASLREKETQEAILQAMKDQNAAAAARGDSPVYGSAQMNAQNDAVAGSDNALDSSLNQANVAAQQQALQSLSPDLASATSSVYALADAWEIMGAASASSAQTAQAAASAMSSGLSAISSLVTASSAATVSGIDAEIAALESSGLTQEEQEQKTKELNKKKIKEQEKTAKASILISTAQGMMLAIATSGNIYAGIALAAATAAAGAMAYQQASNSASSQLASLEGATSAGSSPSSLTVGDTDTNQSVDLSNSATAAERSQSLGEAGVYGRASYGSMSSGKSYLVGEHGKELITPKSDATVSRVSDAQSAGMGSGGRAPTIFNIQALDAQSFADRMYEIAPVMEEYYENQGKHLAAS
ncbi:tail length tape measure protein [Vibrio phage D51]